MPEQLIVDDGRASRSCNRIALLRTHDEIMAKTFYIGNQDLVWRPTSSATDAERAPREFTGSVRAERNGLSEFIDGINNSQSRAGPSRQFPGEVQRRLRVCRGVNVDEDAAQPGLSVITSASRRYRELGITSRHVRPTPCPFCLNIRRKQPTATGARSERQQIPSEKATGSAEAHVPSPEIDILGESTLPTTGLGSDSVAVALIESVHKRSLTAALMESLHVEGWKLAPKNIEIKTLADFQIIENKRRNDGDTTRQLKLKLTGASWLFPYLRYGKVGFC